MKSFNGTSSNLALICAFDAALVLSCFLAVFYVVRSGVDAFGVLLVANVACNLALRQWVSSLLGIHWLLSPLNRLLKKLVDVLTALLFCLTVFPLIIVFQAVACRMNASARGSSVFAKGQARRQDGRELGVLVFNPALSTSNAWLAKAPLMLNVLLFSLSLWDLPSVTLLPLANPEDKLEEEDSDGEQTDEDCSDDSHPDVEQVNCDYKQTNPYNYD